MCFAAGHWFTYRQDSQAPLVPGIPSDIVEVETEIDRRTGRGTTHCAQAFPVAHDHVLSAPFSVDPSEKEFEEIPTACRDSGECLLRKVLFK